MEYRGVHVASRQQVFHYGPVYGTNNIGEFLAIVHGLALLKQKGFDMPIYSDSVNAIGWVKQKKCKTKLPRDSRTEQLFLLIERAEKWLRENTYSTPILKWETKQWGRNTRGLRKKIAGWNTHIPMTKPSHTRGDNVVMPLQKHPYPSTETSSRNCGPDSPHTATVRPAAGNRGARSWKTRFCIRLSYIIHAPKRQNQRATVALKRRDWDAPPLKTEDFNRC